MQGLWNLIGKGGQGPGKDFPYDIGEVIVSTYNEKSVWTMHTGKKKVNGDPVSIFLCDGKVSSPEELHIAKNAYKRLRTLRHPNIITFLDGFESESAVYMVTESLVPLVTFLEQDEGKNRNLITWGVHQIVTGLSFLLNDGNLVHGNVNMFSIFVGMEGEWKLGGVDYMHAANVEPTARIACLAKYDPPEGYHASSKKIKWAGDAWGLGCLVWEIYNGPLQAPTDLKKINKLDKTVIPLYCVLVGANPNSRTNPKEFLEKAKQPQQYLDNDFIRTNLFLQEIQIKDVKEQTQFFTSLDKLLDDFPKQFCIHRVLPQLLNAFEYGAVGSAVLSPLFKVGLLLDDATYQAKIVPCIIKLFSSNDRATRIKLLQQLDKFIAHLQPAIVESQIFQCVATGFGDTLPAMREQTVKAMLLLAPKLSEKTINNSLLRHFSKLQMDEQPGIRTNTTICLGKIAVHLSEATRQKMMVPAFSRALRDNFPPARTAGVLAIAATQDMFSMPDIAQRLLPSLCCLTIDPDKSVRDDVFKVIKGFLLKLENNSTNPESGLNNKEVAEKEELERNPTWTGWAVSSLASKFYTPAATATAAVQKQSADSASQPTSVAGTAASGGEGVGQPKSSDLKGSSVQKSAELQVLKNIELENDNQSDTSDYVDAWEDDKWDDFQQDAESDAIASMREDLLCVRQTMVNASTKLVSSTKNTSRQPAPPGPTNVADDNDSDSDKSDYGNWGQDDWGLNDDSTINNKRKEKVTLEVSPAATVNKASVAEMLGMETDTTDDFFGIGNETKADATVSSKSTTPKNNRGGDAGWDDEEWGDTSSMNKKPHEPKAERNEVKSKMPITSNISDNKTTSKQNTSNKSSPVLPEKPSFKQAKTQPSPTIAGTNLQATGDSAWGCDDDDWATTETTGTEAADGWGDDGNAWGDDQTLELPVAGDTFTASASPTPATRATTTASPDKIQLDEKEKRREEQLRKREQRKLEREKQAREKPRTSGGAMKLGAVKKTSGGGADS